MTNYDIHIHTHLSSCGAKDAFMADYINAASRLGLTTVGFTDHAWDSNIPGASSWYAPQDYKRLEARREELKAIDTKGIKVLLGAEGEFANLLLGLGEEGASYVDYIIVPHSHTHMRGYVLPSDCVGDPKKHALYLLKSFIALCTHKDRNLYFGIAHPMYPIGDDAQYTELLYSHITDNDLQECAIAAKEANLALEANLSVLKKIPPESGKSFCYRRFFDACKRAGCDFFMGSDAHSINAMISNHSASSELISAVGLEESDFTSALRRICNG